jgi:hypothetical protein
MAITFVSSTRAATGAATSLTTSALSTSTTDLVVVWAYWEDATATGTVSWSGSPALTIGTLATQSSVGHECRCQLGWAYGSAITGGAPTASVNLSGGVGNVLINLEVIQIAGTLTSSDPKDIEGAKATTGSNLTSNAFSTSVADEILVAGAFVNSTGGCSTAGLFAGVTGTIATCTMGYRIVSATQSSVTVDLDQNGQDGCMSWAAFKIAGGGGPSFITAPPRLVKQAVNRAGTY